MIHSITLFVHNEKKWRSMPDSDKTQDRILGAAADVIIRLGYDKTNMTDIAEEAA